MATLAGICRRRRKPAPSPPPLPSLTAGEFRDLTHRIVRAYIDGNRMRPDVLVRAVRAVYATLVAITPAGTRIALPATPPPYDAASAGLAITVRTITALVEGQKQMPPGLISAIWDVHAVVEAAQAAEPPRASEARRPPREPLPDNDAGRVLLLTVQVALACARRNRIEPDALCDLMRNVSGALSEILLRMRLPEIRHRPDSETARRSIRDTHLVSFEDGKSYRMLKRHLTERGMTPQTYRAKWNLPDDYPMVAPYYTRKRSSQAKSMKLGHYSRAGQAARAAMPKAPASDDAGAGEDEPVTIRRSA
jgi:predicted transcriptional regulator